MYYSEDVKAGKLDYSALLFCINTSMSGMDVVKTYCQKDWAEKAFDNLERDAFLSSLRCQFPGRLKAYLTVVNSIKYRIMAAVMWEIDFHNTRISYEDLVDILYGIRGPSRSKRASEYIGGQMFPGEHKLIKPFDVVALQT